MPVDVKKAGRTARHSRVSAKHQITIPIQAFSEAGLREGDVVQIKAQGRGRVLIARVDDLLDEYAGCLRTGGELDRAVRGLRQEWGSSSNAQHLDSGQP
jgi:bifunctional DNA-binding transcriptional regulator/antitoxin component of YhaV-PrlF toxin-antitoxin module